MGRIFGSPVSNSLFGIPSTTPAQQQRAAMSQRQQDLALGQALSQFSAAFLQPTQTFVGAPRGVLQSRGIGSAFGQGLLGFQNSLQQSRRQAIEEQLIGSRIGVNQAKTTAAQQALVDARNARSILAGDAPSTTIPAVPGRPGSEVQTQQLGQASVQSSDLGRVQSLLGRASQLDQLNTTQANQAADNLRAQAKALSDNSPAILALREGIKNQSKQVPPDLLRDPAVIAAGVRPGDTFATLQRKLGPGANLLTSAQEAGEETRARQQATTITPEVASNLGLDPTLSQSQAQAVLDDRRRRGGGGLGQTRLPTPAERRDLTTTAQRQAEIRTPTTPISAAEQEDVIQGFAALNQLGVMQKNVDITGRNLRGLRSKAEVLTGLGDKAIAFDDAAGRFRLAQQALIKGVPSNVDQQIIDRITPSILAPKSVNQRRIKVARQLTKDLIAGKIAFLKSTSRRLPPAITEAAKRFGINTRTIRPWTADQGDPFQKAIDTVNKAVRDPKIKAQTRTEDVNTLRGALQ